MASNSKKPITATKAAQNMNSGLVDLTKTGPLTYRQLQQLNSNLADASDSYYEDDVRTISSFSSPVGMHQTPVPDNYDIGESAYDKGIYNPAELADYGEIRANEQGAFIKAVNGTLKGVGLAATTFADGTLGLGVGLAEAVTTSDASRIWDNEVTQSLDALNREMEKYLPNYYSKSELEDPWYTNMISANFIFDKFVKNLGFTIGAAYSGGVYSKALTGIVKGAGKAYGAYKGLTTAEEGLGTLERISKYAELGKRAFNMNNGLKSTKAVLGATMGAIAEGTVEAVSNSNDMVNLQNMELEDKVSRDKQALVEEYKNNIYNGMSEEEAFAIVEAKAAKIDEAAAATRAKIEENRVKMGTADLLANIPILTMDNYFMFGKMFAGGFKAARNSTNTVTKATKEAKRAAKEAWKRGDKSVRQELDMVLDKVERQGYNALTEAEKALVEEAPKHLLSPGIRKAWAIMQSPLREANEEMAQGLAAEASGLYYKPEVDYVYDAAIHPESVQTLADSTTRFWDAVNEGVSNTYGNLNRWEEGFIGGLTGAFGAPTFGKKNNRTEATYRGRNKAIGMTGGTFADIREFNRKRKEENDIAKNINRIVKDPATSDRWKHVAAQVTFDRDKKEGARLNDKKKFKDAETAAIFEDIMYAKRAGRMDLIEKMLGSIEEATPEEIQQIVKDTEQLVSARDNSVSQYKKDLDILNNRQAKISDQLDLLNNQIQQAYHLNDSPKVIEALEIQAQSLRDEYQKNKREISIKQSYLDTANTKVVSPYIHEDGTVFTEEEVRKSLGKRVDKARKLAKQISEIQDKLDFATDQVLSDEQLSTLTYFEVVKRDYEERGASIIDSMKKEIDDTGILDIVADGLQAHIDNINEELNRLGASVPEAFSKKQRQAIQSLRNAQRKIRQLLENPNDTMNLLVYGSYTTKDKDGKEVKHDYGTEMLDLLINAIKDNDFYSESDKNERLRDIEDLKRIVESYRKYDETMTEFFKDPSKIDKAHTASDNRAVQATKRGLYNKLKAEIDFSNPDSIKAVLDKYKDAIEQSGGINKFIATLSKEERDAVRKVLDNDDKIKLVSRAITESQETERIKNLARRVVEESEVSGEELIAASRDSSDKLDEAIAKVAAEAIEEAGIEDIVEKEKELTKLEEKLQQVLNSAIIKSASKAAEAEKDRQRAIDKEIKEAADKGEQEEAKKEEAIKRAVEAEKTAEEVTVDDIENKIESIVKEDRKEQHAGLTSQPRKKGYDRRRQLSEFYLFGEYGETLADYYKQNPKAIPDGVDPDDFIEYIENTTKLLKEAGAYTYISGTNKDSKLNVNDKIIFEVDPKFTHKGVKVVVMKTESGQIIGTIRSQYEFDAYDYTVKNGGERNTTIEAQRELYKAVIKQSEEGTEPITTTVESLNKGSLPVVSKDSLVSDVFGDEVPIIGIVTGDMELKLETGGRVATDKIAMPDSIVLKRGQVYVLIPTNTGTFIPALCYSVPMKDLSKDDPYIQHVVDLFMEAIPSNSNILENKNEIIKWFPILDNSPETVKTAKNLHINLAVYDKDGGEKASDKWSNVDTIDKATHIKINFTQKDGSPFSRFIKLDKEDGTRKSNEEIRQEIEKFVLDTAKKQELQTNIDKRRLNDKEYISMISGYIKVNLYKGEAGRHSMNDGFLYKATDIEAQYEARGKKFDDRPKTKEGRGTITTEEIIYNGHTYTLDASGTLRDSTNNEEITGNLKQEVLDSRTPKPSEDNKDKKDKEKEKGEQEEQEDKSKTGSKRKKIISGNPFGGGSRRRSTPPLRRRIVKRDDADEDEDENETKNEEPVKTEQQKSDSKKATVPGIVKDIKKQKPIADLIASSPEVAEHIDGILIQYMQNLVAGVDADSTLRAILFAYNIDIDIKPITNIIKANKLEITSELINGMSARQKNKVSKVMTDVLARLNKQLSYENLNSSQKESLKARGISIEDYNNLALVDRIPIIKC